MSIRLITTRFAMLVIASGLWAVSCGGGDSPTRPTPTTPSPPTPPPPPTVSVVEVSPNTATLEVGKTQRFVATAKSSDGTVISGVNFAWSSSNTAVATINNNGVATAVAAGTATIRATGNGVSSAAVTITVTVAAVASVTVSPSSTQELMVGETVTFTAMARTAGGTVRDDVSITWASSDTSVVTITSGGVATAVGAGSAMIRATADGISSSPVTINVAEAPPPEPVVAMVTVSPSEAMIEADATQQFTATAYESDNTVIPGKSFSWKSSDTDKATISSTGLATAKEAGSTTITATVDGVSGTATLTVTEPPPVVDRVTVSPSSPSIEEGETQQFTATAYESDNTVIPGKSFSWKSSDTDKATISSTGLATAKEAGSTTITATVDGVSGTATLTVTEPPPVVDRVTVSPSSPSIEEGETQQFTATAYESDNTVIPGKSFSWKSSDTDKATISSTGLATAKEAGSTTITATVDGVSGTATLTVTEPPPVVDRVTVSPSSPSIEEGETQQFTATAYESDNTVIPGKSFSWKSSDTDKATISSTGLATAKEAGSTTITATVDGVSGTATLTVTEPPPVVDRVTVSPSSPSIEEGETQQFTATAYESDNTVIPGKSFSWKSSDTDKATISSTGLATAKEAGSTTITATVDGVSGTATLTVTEPPPVVDRVTVSPSSPSIEEGETQQFTATAYESDNTVIPGKSFSWKSSDTDKATISSTGLATAKEAGSTTITATVDGVSGTATLTVTEPPPVVDRVTVSPSSPSIEEGETQQFTATAYESDNTVIPGKSFSWKSSDTDKATISSTGLATAKEAGSTTITATVDGVSGTATLTVTEPPPVVDRVTVSPSSPSIEEGETQQFTATAYESDNTVIPGKSFSWKSSDTDKATISSTGLATAKEAGSTTITATVDGVSGTATLTVTEPPPVVDRVTVSPSSPSIEEGETQQFTATAYESDNTVIPGKSFSWKSSDTDKATISSTGLATAKEAGSTTITATVDGVSGTATLTVTEPPPVVDRVTVSPSSPSIEEGETQQFTATAYESDNTVIPGKSFSWKSSDTDKATISSTGLATAKEAGSTTITATVDGVSGTATLTVTEPPPVVDRVTVSPSSPSIEEGETQQFTATAYESDNTVIPGKSFSWKSSDTDKATISSTGLATAKEAGSTTITATVDGVSGTATLTVTEPPPVVDRVTVSPSSPSIEEGETQQFTATAYESDNTVIPGKSFSWKSSDTDKATISSTGLATAKEAGSTTITATVDGVSGTATLTVTEPPPVVDRVTVSPSSPSIEEGETQQFTATAYESDNTVIPGKSFSWKSSDTDKATISSTGLATAKEAGSTTITATVDGVSGTATLTVTEPPPVVDRVTVSPSSPSIEEGETQQFTATAYESDNTVIPGKSFSWKSSDTDKATISSTGLATAKEAGSTTITATVDGVSGTATLTVTEPPPVVDRVTVSPSSPSIEEGETQQFTATAYESDNTVIPGKSFSWKSSDTDKATISSTGLATAKEAGSTTITATVDGVSGTATLTVTEPPPLRSRTGTISGRNNYSSGGSVTLSETSDGKLKLSITGLSTPGAAPDVYVALYTSSDINWPNGGSLPDGARGFGEVSRQSGNKSWTFTPAAGENIDSWSHLILHCRLIDSEVGSASLSN